MSVKHEFLNKFQSISDKFSKSIAVYCVLNYEITLGVTYFDLRVVSNELSDFFSGIFKDTQYIGVSVTDYFFLPCIILGIWKSGNAFAGAGSQYTLERTLQYFDFLHIKYIITDKDENKLGGKVISSFFIHEQKLFILHREVHYTQENIPVPWDICYGIMTSGTTGDSKIIQVPWTCILPNVEELSELFQINELDRIYQSSPYTFDPFFIELFLSLINGASLIIVSNIIKLCPSNLVKILFGCEDNNITVSKINFSCLVNENQFLNSVKNVLRKNVSVIQMTPSVFKKWSDKEIMDSILTFKTSLRILILGGEKFPKDILELRHKENKTKIFNIYGITEISCWAYINEVTNCSPDEEVSFGKPLGSIEFKISETGEFHIGSKKRICPINNESIVSRETTVYRNSGDVVKLVNGKIFYMGRSTQIIKKYGIKINLAKIEEVFLSVNKFMKECYCVYDELSKKLGLFYSPVKENKSLENYVLINYIDFLKRGYEYPQGKINDIERPDYLIELNDIPVNSHGKCDRNELLKFLQNIRKIQVSEPDLNEIFKSIWCEVLGINKNNMFVGGFVNLGGNSILALQIVNKLEDKGFKVPQSFIPELLRDGKFATCLMCLNDVTNDYKIPKKKIKIDEKMSEPDIKVSVKWKFDLKKCVDATPTLVTYQGVSRIIVGSHSSRLCCLDSEVGTEIWTITLGDRIESGFRATRDGARGFIGCYDHCVYCIKVSDGENIWKYETQDIVKSTPCLSSDESVVYIASYDKCIHCVIARTGQIIKKLKLSDGGIYSSGIVSARQNSLYIGTLDGTCISLHQHSNELNWKRKLKTPVFASPCFVSQEEKIIFAEVSGLIQCFEINTGTTIWSYEAKGNIYSTPSVHELEDFTSRIIFGCHDKHVYCLLYGETVELQWRQQVDSSVFASPSLCLDLVTCDKWTVCAATTKGIIYLCNVASGLIKTELKLSGEIFSSPISRQNALFVGCRDNYLYCLRAETV